MRITTRTGLALAAAAVTAGGLGIASPAAMAEGNGEHSYQAQLSELNDSGASGTAWITLDGNEAWVKMETHGLLKDAPHAQHIHIGGAGKCPDPNMKGSGVDGAIRVSDAMDDYGMIGTSLTLKGKTGPDQGLAVDDFPTSDTTYERSITVSDDVKKNIEDGKAVVVVHGVDHNGSGKYDGKQMSDLDDKLPSEATDPAACGELTASQMDSMPSGGVETGDGTTAGVEDIGLMAAGAGVLGLGALGLGIARRRSVRSDR